MTQLSNVRVTDEQLAVWKAEAKRVMHHPATPMDIHCHAYATYVLATELQERRSAAAQEPVAVVDIQRGRGDGRKYALCYTSAGHSLPDDVYNLYAEPQPVAVPEWTNEECLEFLSIAFRHAEIKGDLELDDIRLGVKMVNACRAAMLQSGNHTEQHLDMVNSQVIPDDVSRMDWLVSKTVDVREPMAYGSHSLFWSQTITDEEDDYHATKLREQIDAAMAVEQAAEPQQEVK